MAWRFNNPATLTLSRSEAHEVYEALKFFQDQWEDRDPDSRIRDVMDRMKQQIEHKERT